MSCIETKCVGCPDHTIVSGKVSCNRNNRLKFKGATIADMLSGEDDNGV